MPKKLPCCKWYSYRVYVTLEMIVGVLSAFLNHYRQVFTHIYTSVFCALFLSLAIYSHLRVALELLFL